MRNPTIALLLFGLLTGFFSTTPAVAKKAEPGATLPVSATSQKANSTSKKATRSKAKSWEPICPPDCGTSRK